MKKENYNFLLKDIKICITGGSGFIGSNLIRIILDINRKVNILNIDKNQPIENTKLAKWVNCDINHKEVLSKILLDFKPDYIIHLAADATMSGKSLDDYKTNILGVENLIEAVRPLSNDTMLIVASSQHVKKPGSFIYSNANEYEPLGLYGESKMITEKLIKEAKLHQKWYIVRPTLVWGPGNYVMAEAIFKYIKKNLYFHPFNDNTVRSYGYIDNVCYQILKLCSLEYEMINEKTLYLADNNLLQREWLSIANALMGNGQLRTVPQYVLKGISSIGDYIKFFYPKFPLYTERFLNLTTSNPIPLETTFSLLGVPPIGIHQAMKTTINWINDYYKKV